MRPLRTATAALLAAAAFLGIAGCGGSGDSTSSASADADGPTPNRDLAAGFTGVKRQAVAAAQDYIDAFSRGDEAAVCELTTAGSAQSAIEKCKQTLSTLGPSKQPEFSVAYVRVSGNSAKVLLRPTGTFGDPTLFDLRRVGGDWKTITVSVPVIGAQ